MRSSAGNAPAGALAAILAVTLLVNFAWPREYSGTESSGTAPLSGISSAYEKNPDTALVWSLVGTAIPVGLLAARADPFLVATAWLVGPSAGLFYGGLLGRGFLGIGIRLIGESILLLGGFLVWMEYLSSDQDNKGPETLMWTGAGIVLASALWDVVTVKGAVQKRNARRRERMLAFSPIFIPQTRTVGLRIKVQF